MFAATNGSVARSGESFPYVQLKISFSLISTSPFHCNQEAAVAGRLDRTNNVAHQSSQRWQVFLRGRITSDDHQHLADRYLLHLPAELACEAIRAPHLPGMEVVNARPVVRGDRPEAGAQQVDPLDAPLVVHVEHEMLLDRL